MRHDTNTNDELPEAVGRTAVLGDMVCLRLVGSLKLQIFFVKVPYKRDDILQKRFIILRSLLIVATPYRAAKTHRMPYLYRSFSAKEPYNLWLFCGI